MGKKKNKKRFIELEVVMNNISIKTVTNKLLDRDFFALIYTMMCILWAIPLVGQYLDIVNKICFIWGAMIIFVELVIKRKIFKIILWGFPTVMIIEYTMSVLVNHNYNFYMGIKNIVYLSIALLLLYGRDRNSSFESLTKLLRRVTTFVIVCSFIVSFISIILYCFRIAFSFNWGDTSIRQGFLENRLFGVYYGPNAGFVFSIVSIASMFIHSAIRNEGKICLNSFYIANLIVQIIYFSLTLSNGGFLTLLAFEIMIVLTYVMPKIVSKNRIKAILLFLIISVSCVGITYGLMSGVRYVMAYVPSLISSIGKESTHDDPDSEEDDKIEFQRIESGEDASNGRVVIWSGGLKALAQHPVLGYADFWIDEGSDTRFDMSVLSDEEEARLYKHEGNLHNVYMQVLVFSGIAGFVLFISFAVVVVIKIGRALIKGKKEGTLYNLIAIIFSLLVAFMANGMVESHLIYRRQNVFGSIFWLFVGIILVLVELYENSDEFRDKDKPNSEKFAFVVGTPIQAINAMRFVLGNVEGSRGSSDVFIYHMFNGSHELSSKLKESRIFNNVYDIAEYKEYDSLKSRFVTVCRLAAPKITINMNRDGGEKIPLSDKFYRHICLSYPLSFMINLHMAYPMSDTIIYEDGIGSYFGNILDRSSNLLKIFDKLLGGNIIIKPDRVYLSNPGVSKSEFDCEILSLPSLKNDPNISVINDVFDYDDHSVYMSNGIVFLGQPIEERENFSAENAERIEEMVSNSFGKKYIYRLHPRQQANRYDGTNIDYGKNLWELECIHNVSDESVLIGCFSTAQFMPKILKDAEPILIFTYKLIVSDFEDPYYKDIDSFVMSFRDFYGNSDKIFVPETFESLEKVLSDL